MKQRHIFSSEILKACDIRGIVGEELNNDDAYYTGRSFGTSLIRLGLSTCIVGYDGRLSSRKLSDRVIDGLTESGIQVILVGLVPTPVVYFAVNFLKADAGLIVTASHNPPEYNGFKFITCDGPFHGEQIQNFSLLCEQSDFENGIGIVKEMDITEDYISYLYDFLNKSPGKNVSVVWDPGNGASAAVLSAFLKELPGKHKIICGEVDGNFPHHHPDPSREENIRHLKEAILDEGADFGIAFDGDGDRIGVVDGEGFLLYGDQLLTLFARDFLKDNPDETVMSEVKASRFFYDDVAARGGKPLMWKVGHTHQKEKMKKDRIKLAGETSGHIFFAENKGWDDAMFASIKLLNILTDSSKTLTEIRKEFPVYFDSGEIRIVLSTKERLRVISEISSRLREDERSFIDIDGIRVDSSDGFWMMRGSNTQPHITIRCEAASKEGLSDCIRDMKKQLTLSGIDGKKIIGL